MKRIVLLILCLTMLFVCPVSIYAADIELPDLIGDHMLIQQGKPIKLWGTVSPGETVSIKLGTKNKAISKGSAVADSDGTFHAELPSVMAGGPYTLTFSTETATKTVQDVLVGELWVQSGQSNMAGAVNGTGTHKNEFLPDKPMDKIRLFMNTKQEESDTRQTDLQGAWQVATREAVGTYSALGYAALEKIYENIDMPVGGICCAYGGAAMAPWQGPSEKGGTGGVYYNKKAAPLTQFNIRGVIWQQGSANRGNSPELFASTFEQLITSWRRDWDDPDMPFVFATMYPSPMRYKQTWSPYQYIIEDFSNARLGQLKAYNDVENTAIAVTVDCPPVKGVDKDPLHPTNKKPGGERLGLAALGLVYGAIDKWSSPLYQSAEVSGNTATIKFSHAYDGLKTTDGKAPRCFMASENGTKFFNATAEITGKDTVKITCPEISKINYVSYCVETHLFPYTSVDDMVIDTYPDVNLVNSENLPACTFSYAATEVIPEKKHKYQINTVDETAALGESYAFNDTVTLTRQDGSTVEKDVVWSINSIDTKSAKTVSFYGLAEDEDLIIPAKITVKEVSDNPLPSVSANLQGTKLTATVPAGDVKANRAIYVTAAFYDRDEKFISAKLIPVFLKAGTANEISFSADIPQNAATAKVMVMGQNMRLYLSDMLEIE